MTTLPPAPEAVIQLVKCGCAEERCSTNRCQCRKANLNCTDSCNCCDSGGICENSHNPNDDLEEDEDVTQESDGSSGQNSRIFPRARLSNDLSDLVRDIKIIYLSNRAFFPCLHSLI